MTIYKCRRGHVFDEGEMVRDTYPEGEGTRYRYLCPDCGTEDFEEAYTCSRCRFFFREDELEYHLCEKCRDELYDEVVENLSKYQGDEREYLRHRFDEREGAFA